MKDTYTLTKRYTLIALLIFLVFSRNNVLASIDSIADENVKVEDDHISIQAKGITLGKLLKEIEKKGGVEFKLKKSLLEKKVSVSFRKLPLSEGLKKILYPLNYAFIHGLDGKISKVFIVDQGKASASVSFAVGGGVFSPESYNSSPMEAEEESGGPTGYVPPPPGNVPPNQDEVPHY